MREPAKTYLYRNPNSGVYTGFWACMRPHGKFRGLWPGGLLERVFELVGKPEVILEPFAGTSRIGLSIDLNKEVKPDIVADAQHLPLKPDSIDMVLMDPPYNSQELRNYLGKKIHFSIYRALGETKRIVKKDGHVVLLHFLIPKHIGRDRFRRVATIGISTGPNKNIRCLTIFRRYR